MNNIVLYTLTDPLTNQVRYVGEGLPHRPYQHEKFVKSGKQTASPRLTSWIKNLIESGKSPIVSVVTAGLTKDEALDMEEALIKQHGRVGFEDGGILLNIAERGKSYDRAGINNPMFGKTLSQAAKQKIGSKNRRPKPAGFDETMRKVALSRQPASPESRAKMSVSQKMRFSSQTERDKLGAQVRGSSWKKNLFRITLPNGVSYVTSSIGKFSEEHGVSRCALYDLMSGKRIAVNLAGWSIERLSNA